MSYRREVPYYQIDIHAGARFGMENCLIFWTDRHLNTLKRRRMTSSMTTATGKEGGIARLLLFLIDHGIRWKCLRAKSNALLIISNQASKISSHLMLPAKAG